MTDRFKLPLHFDAKRLHADLASLEQSDWIEHFVTQNYSGSWSVLPLRALAGETHPVRMIYSDPGCKDFVPTPFLDRAPYFKEVLDAFACPLLAVRLMKLSAGSAIKEHRDHDLDYEQGVVRLHIPVVTNRKVKFYLNDSRVVMQEGECWYLRLSDPHRVVNGGKTDRVHLVIDAEVNQWLDKMFGVV